MCHRRRPKWPISRAATISTNNPNAVHIYLYPQYNLFILYWCSIEYRKEKKFILFAASSIDHKRSHACVNLLMIFHLISLYDF